MPQSPIRKSLAAALLAGFCLVALPTQAETLEELDALSDLATDEAAGVAAARDYALQGQYLDALALLERVLAVHPTSTDALLMHAVFLCQIDDPQGGQLELSKLKEKQYQPQLLADARALCANAGRR